jgi:hypothetical protein
MSPLKSSLAQSAPAPETDTVAPSDASFESPSVKLTTDLTQVTAMPSPALHLQDSLRHAWSASQPVQHTAANERKIPIGWALTVVLVGCGAFWACLAAVIF